MEPQDDSRPDQPDSPSNSSSNEAAVTNSTGNDDKTHATIEKTISCISCRKRKLKCDRTKPKCGTCSRLRHDCEYPERRRNAGSRRRNMKELEARLAQVETQLISETSKNTPPKNEAPPMPAGEPDWNSYPTDMNMDFESDPLLNFPISDSTFTFQPQIPTGDFFSQEIISMGLQEPLPPDEMIADLHDLYFDKLHSTLPLLHKTRYLAGLHLPPHMQPPACLRYTIWAMTASISDKYSCYEDVLYERARRYIEQAEMKGFGETFVTVQHAQTWCLLGTYEAKKTYFTRAWMSSGRAVRLCHMLGLQRLDGQGQDVKQILSPPKDWTELEERRRTFWAAFYADRWASSGTGWPMLIDEKTIMTNLPASEEAFEQGNIQNTVSLQEALTPPGASQITPFGGVILSACLFGHNFHHLHQSGPDERPEDLDNGEFWKRHRKMDNVLSHTFMFLPDHLRLPSGLRDMNIVFLHMNIHASTICLHQAAIVTAERNKINLGFIRQSRDRSLMAAEEIANIMRLISHLDASNMNSWVGFCLYIASRVFIQDLRHRQKSSSLANLEFIHSAMKAIGTRHAITEHFTAQVELDIEGNGISVGCSPQTSANGPHQKSSMFGIMPDMDVSPNRVDEVPSLYMQETMPSRLNPSKRPALGIYLREKGAVFESIYGVLPRSGTLAVVESPENSSSNGSMSNNLNLNGSDSLPSLDSNHNSQNLSNPGNQTSSLDPNSMSATASGPIPPSVVCSCTVPHVNGTSEDNPSFFDGSMAGNGLPLFENTELGFDMSPIEYPYRGVNPSNLRNDSYSMFSTSKESATLNGHQTPCAFISGQVGAAAHQDTESGWKQ